MSRCWIALLDAPAADADAQAAVTEIGGSPAGWLAAWLRRTKPVREARRVDARLVDPGGAPARASLVRPPPGVKLLFDDLAVQQARREVLARLPEAAVSTLLGDASHFEGAITVARGARRRAPGRRSVRTDLSGADPVRRGRRARCRRAVVRPDDRALRQRAPWP